MADSFSEQVSRLCHLTDKWDLSHNDIAAIEAVLQSHRELLAALKKAKTGDCWCPKGIGHPSFQNHTTDCERASAAIAKAEGK